ncbi:MAG: hypothetical protein KF887_07005 [Paracoccaceae bacterium]|nr:MAG: hypothetical protein KF887_07005 [Paracoccaceae bacterium]
MIHVFNEPRPGFRLKSFSSSSKGERSILKIELEIDDPMEVAFLLKELANLTRAQKAKPKALLALPRPDGRP